MSFGWKRTEIVGALINACSLLSLCLYILLEAIPRFIHPEEIKVDIAFLSVAGAGIVCNLIGTIVFYLTGTHAHAHAHDEGDEIDIDAIETGHSHGEQKAKKSKHAHHDSHDHGKHSINTSEGHDDEQVVLDLEGVEGGRQKKKHNHDHDHDHDHSHDGHEHKHDHEHKKDKKKNKKHDHEGHNHKHDHKHDHDHDHKHSHGGHDHSHGGHDHSHGGHGHSHDMNMWAVFVHYLGDAISSVFVLATGLLVYYFPNKKWSAYLDPGSSLFIVAVMLYSTLPLVRQCALILLQRVPPHVNLQKLRTKLLALDHVMGAHDLHVWCLVDGMTICTVHMALDSPDNFELVAKDVRKLFHKFNIHSSTIQPEYPLNKLSDGDNYNSAELMVLAKRSTQLSSCDQNCLPTCQEDWCCKQSKPPKQRANHGAIDFDPVFNPREPDPPRLNPPPGDKSPSDPLDLV